MACRLVARRMVAPSPAAPSSVGAQLGWRGAPRPSRCVRARAAQVADVNAMLKAASEEGPLAASAEHGDILGYETQPLVSTDYINDVRSSIVDAASTMMVGDKMLKIYAWYDNEAGYSMRTAELARLVARKFF